MVLSRLAELRRAILVRTEMRAFARDLTVPLTSVSPRIGVRIRAATLADLPRLAAVVGPVRYMVHALGVGSDIVEALGDLYRRGCVCYMAERDGAILHFRWVRRSDASIPRLGITVPLLPDEAYGFSMYTVPEARGALLGPAVMTAVLADLRDQGVRTVYVWVMSGNTAALHTTDRYGGREVGRVMQWVWRMGAERLVYAVLINRTSDTPHGGLCTPGRLTLRKPLLPVRYVNVPSDVDARSSAGDGS